jgi:hypothetical protein
VLATNVNSCATPYYATHDFTLKHFNNQFVALVSISLSHFLSLLSPAHSIAFR